MTSAIMMTFTIFYSHDSSIETGRCSSCAVSLNAPGLCRAGIGTHHSRRRRSRGRMASRRKRWILLPRGGRVDVGTTVHCLSEAEAPK